MDKCVRRIHDGTAPWIGYRFVHMRMPQGDKMLKMHDSMPMRRSMRIFTISAAGKTTKAALAFVLAALISCVFSFGQQSRREIIYMNGKAIVTETSAFANPAIVITYPTSAAAFNTSASSITVAGNASEASGINAVTWSNNRGGNGACTGTASWN
jgi:hypothetical protein